MRSLSTRRLTLEPQCPVHAAEMFTLLSDPALYQFEDQPPPSLAWLQARYARLEARVAPDGSEQWLNWVLRLRDDPHPGRLIGYVQATVGADHQAYIAYVLHSAYWGQGLASEAVRAMLVSLQTQYRVRQCFAILKRANVRSLHVLERLGFALHPPLVPPHPAVGPDEWLMHGPATCLIF